MQVALRKNIYLKPSWTFWIHPGPGSSFSKQSPIQNNLCPYQFQTILKHLQCPAQYNFNTSRSSPSWSFFSSLLFSFIFVFRGFFRIRPSLFFFNARIRIRVLSGILRRLSKEKRKNCKDKSFRPKNEYLFWTCLEFNNRKEVRLFFVANVFWLYRPANSQH